VLGSRGTRALLAAAGVMLMLSAGLAEPARAAPGAPQAGSGPALYGFGSNQSGELGNGTTAASLSPVAVGGLPGAVRQISTGLRASAAVMSDGSLWTWGNDYYGQLGYSSATVIVSTPRQVPGLSAVSQVALSDEGNGYAVGSGGSLWAWGDNSYGQLGNGTTTASSSPILVPGLTGVTQVAAGGYYTLALRSDGSVWAWGLNSGGELGDGTTTSQLRPEQVPGLTGITQIVSGGGSSFAVRSDGTLFSWGENGTGALGNGTAGGFSDRPTPVAGLTGVTQVASNSWATLAVAGTAMRVWAWGDNECGELGDGTAVSKLSPELIGLVGVTQIVTGSTLFSELSSAAVRYDGTLWTWGCNSYGELGHGAVTGYVASPTMVTSLARVSQFAFGDDYSGLFLRGAYGLAVGSLPAIVPNLSGDTTARASQALQAAGLVLGTVATAIDYTCSNVGAVMSQNPAAGTAVNSGSAVSVTIGKAPPPPHQCL
jgi:alpha-tubulin suppressor-like RCC1 family protein